MCNKNPVLWDVNDVKSVQYSIGDGPAKLNEKTKMEKRQEEES